MAHNISLSLFLCICACALLAYALQYSDLEDLKVETCPSRNSCPQGSSESSNRICECDSSCAFYNDCCINANRGRPKKVTTQICMPYGLRSLNGVYAVADCPSSFKGPEEVRNQCRKGDVRDPILNAPVTDTSKRRTYLNSYCALCNEASPRHLKIWVMSTCKSDSKHSWDDIIYREDVNRWGSLRNGEFQACDFMFDMPPSIEKNLRMCRPNLVSSCPRGYTRATYRRACEAYLSVTIGNGTALYRNPHCALCNGVPSGSVKCFDPSVLGQQKPFSFALLLDVNRSDGDLVGMRNNCSAGQKYDPYFKKCRTLVCAIPGYKMVDGKCVKD